MAYTALNNNISSEIVILYISAIFWTLGYDTIYGSQDMSDDEIIGIKSTSIKFKKSINLFISTVYFISIGLLVYLFKGFLGLNIFSFFLLLFILSLVYQTLNIKKKNKNFLKLFKFNNYSGLFLFLGIYFINWEYEI